MSSAFTYGLNRVPILKQVRNMSVTETLKADVRNAIDSGSDLLKPVRDVYWSQMISL